MRNGIIFAVLCAVMCVAVFVGSYRDRTAAASQRQAGTTAVIPHIGRIQVLNGCGITGAAGAAADFLRRHGFDIKNTGDADTWNYPFTIIVARTTDMSVARQVSGVLRTDKVVMLRDGEDIYDVTVVLGADFAERIE